MRTSGSTLFSGLPSVASITAICRATSQLTGPWSLNSLARSPKIGSCSKGFPDGPGELMNAMVGPVRTVTVIGSDTSSTRSVADRLSARDFSLVPAGRSADTLVYLESALPVPPDASTRTVVYVSSAMVYGAWPNNPVPLTEDAPMRPNPGFGYATAKAES